MYEEYDSVRFFFFFGAEPFGFLADLLAGVFLAGGICVSVWVGYEKGSPWRGRDES